MKLTLKGSLWHHRDFAKFWIGDTITQFTGQVTTLVLPTLAILTLDVTSFQLGILNALGFIAFPTLGLFAGVLLDRVRRKPVMIFMNVIRLVTLAVFPLPFFWACLVSISYMRLLSSWEPACSFSTWAASLIFQA